MATGGTEAAVAYAEIVGLNSKVCDTESEVSKKIPNVSSCTHEIGSCVIKRRNSKE